MTDSKSELPPKRRTNWRRFSLRALVGAMIAAGILLAAARNEFYRYERELVVLRKLGIKLVRITAVPELGSIGRMLRTIGPEYSECAVREVEFDEYVITDEDLRLVSELRRLESVTLPPGGYSPEALDLIFALPELKRVRIWTHPPPDGKLHLITGRGQSIRPPGLDRDNAPWPEVGLENDRPRVELSERHFESLAQAPRLTEIDLTNVAVRPTFLTSISANSPLESLHLEGTLIDDDLIQQMPPLKKLTRLNLHRTRVSGLGLSRFAALEDLTLTATPVSAAGLADLRSLAQLTSLDLSDSEADDAMITATVPPPAVAYLTLRRTKTSGVGLSSWTSLESLDLGESRLTSKSLDELRPLPKLHTLYLDGCAFDASSINSVAALPALKTVRIPSSVLSSEEYSRLKTLRPTLVIDEFPQVSNFTFTPVRSRPNGGDPNREAPQDATR